MRMVNMMILGVVRRDEIEPLPKGYPGFWIQNPASIVHMVAEPDHYRHPRGACGRRHLRFRA